MDYKKHYDLLIKTRRNRVLKNEIYYEKHHIIPKSLGGTNEKTNIIKLTAREHFIAHWLLWRIYQNKEMAFAFFSMVYMRKNGVIISSRVYEESKIARRKYIEENNKIYHKNKKLSKEQINKISERLRGVGKSIDHRKKISNSLKNKQKTLEHKKNLSKSLKNYDWSSYTERNQKISLSNSGQKNGRSKVVILFNKNNEIITKFTTMKDALTHVNEHKKFSKTTFYRYVLNKKLIGNVYYSFE
jgi:hypothetical protein